MSQWPAQDSPGVPLGSLQQGEQQALPFFKSVNPAFKLTFFIFFSLSFSLSQDGVIGCIVLPQKILKSPPPPHL